MFALSQWEMALHYNDVSHWLGANQESALYLLLCLKHQVKVLFEKNFTKKETHPTQTPYWEENWSDMS